jgi:hypothetical protein
MNISARLARSRRRLDQQKSFAAFGPGAFLHGAHPQRVGLAGGTGTRRGDGDRGDGAGGIHRIHIMCLAIKTRSKLYRSESAQTYSADNKFLHNALKILKIFFMHGLLSDGHDNKHLRNTLKTLSFSSYASLLSDSSDNKPGSRAGAGL